MEEREGTAAGLFLGGGDEEVSRLDREELSDLLSGPEPPVVLDVRSRSSYERDGGQIPGSVRVLPDRVTEWAAQHAPGRMVVAYCT